MPREFKCLDFYIKCSLSGVYDSNRYQEETSSNNDNSPLVNQLYDPDIVIVCFENMINPLLSPNRVFIRANSPVNPDGSYIWYSKTNYRNERDRNINLKVYFTLSAWEKWNVLKRTLTTKRWPENMKITKSLRSNSQEKQLQACKTNHFLKAVDWAESNTHKQATQTISTWTA